MGCDSVYIVRCPSNGLCKIGYSFAARHRFEMLCFSSPVPIELLHIADVDDPREVERQLHDMFAPKRHHGEWFELTEADIGLIVSLWPQEPSERWSRALDLVLENAKLIAQHFRQTV